MERATCLGRCKLQLYFLVKLLFHVQCSRYLPEKVPISPALSVPHNESQSIPPFTFHLSPYTVTIKGANFHLHSVLMTLTLDSIHWRLFREWIKGRFLPRAIVCVTGGLCTQYIVIRSVMSIQSTSQRERYKDKKPVSIQQLFYKHGIVFALNTFEPWSWHGSFWLVYKVP